MHEVYQLQEEKSKTKDKSGFSFVPTGPGKGTGSGVYFIDFSDDYKRCLKLARDKVEREEKLSQLEKDEMNWIKSLKQNREKSLNEKMLQLKVSLHLHIQPQIYFDLRHKSSII